MYLRISALRAVLCFGDFAGPLGLSGALQPPRSRQVPARRAGQCILFLNSTGNLCLVPALHPRALRDCHGHATATAYELAPPAWSVPEGICNAWKGVIWQRDYPFRHAMTFVLG
jgi:hypothetical protein